MLWARISELHLAQEMFEIGFSLQNFLHLVQGFVKDGA
jgi:hypothetical protein